MAHHHHQPACPACMCKERGEHASCTGAVGCTASEPGQKFADCAGCLGWLSVLVLLGVQRQVSRGRSLLTVLAASGSTAIPSHSWEGATCCGMKDARACFFAYAASMIVIQAGAIVGKIKAYHKLLKTFATNGKLELSLLLTVQAMQEHNVQGKGEWRYLQLEQQRASRLTLHAMVYKASSADAMVVVAAACVKADHACHGCCPGSVATYRINGSWMERKQSPVSISYTCVQVQCYEDNRLLKLFSDIVRVLYDADIVGEDTIMFWWVPIASSARVRHVCLPRNHAVFKEGLGAVRVCFVVLSGPVVQCRKKEECLCMNSCDTLSL
eukprot:1075592-Pelagomonas_calceolata.AAC.9